MRSVFYTFAAFAVIGLAYWAYNENYATQNAQRRVDELRHRIGENRVQLNILRAEWAYLNRPDRLRELVDLNYPVLQLMPLAPEHFGNVNQVAFPKLDLADLNDPVDLVAEFEGTTAELPVSNAEVQE
ncbi:MAG: hypothetical protein ACI8YI_001240 [Paracoccaceae bacterium]|jgi:hypothetical protein